MKNKRFGYGIAAAIVLAVLVLFGGWFWSLGEAHAGQPPEIRIESVKQPVEWRHANETEWVVLSGPITARQGDVVRTGEGGEARIIWGDRGTTRIDPGSELTLETIPEDGSLNPGAQIKLKLESGRVWSRVIKLLDLGSSMQVDASDVVATVRGTSFGAAVVPEGAEFAVTESVVEVAGASGTRTLLRDNQWGGFDLRGTPRTVRALLSSDEWATRNRDADKREERHELSVWRTRLEERARILKNTPAFLLDASESLHLSVASGEKKRELATAYAERRLALLTTEHRSQDVARFRSYVSLTGDAHSRLLGDWHGLATLRGRTGEGDVAGARIWRNELAPASVPNRAYLDAVSMDDRIDDLLAISGARDAKVIDGLRADIDLFEKGIGALDASDDQKGALRRKAEALRVRLESIGETTVTQVPEISVPGTTPEPGTQIHDTAKRPPAVIKPVPTETKPATYQRYQLLASPSSVAIGQAVKLTLFGITSSGQADDLTARATFSGPSGAISGNIYIPTVAGTITLNGSVDGKMATASVVVTKAAPVSGLQGISIQFTGPTVMGCSAYSAFKVIATYAGGKTADVTMLSKLSVTDPKLIYVNTNGSLMSFCTAGTATANLNASYAENQVTKTASQTITVAKDPSAVTKGCTGRYCQ